MTSADMRIRVTCLSHLLYFFNFLYHQLYGVSYRSFHSLNSLHSFIGKTPISRTVPLDMQQKELWRMNHLSSQVKLSFIVIPLHVGTYSGTKCHASRVHGAT